MHRKMTTDEFRGLLHNHVEKVLSGVEPIRGKYELEVDIRARMDEVDDLLRSINVQLVDESFHVTKAELTNTAEGVAAAI